MSKQISDKELDLVVQVVARLPDGGSLDEIVGNPTIKLPRRTLQRRLARLVRQGRLLIERKGRWSRYSLPVSKPEIPPANISASQSGAGLSISTEAAAIRRAVHAPIQNRHPVGYDRDFLDGYRPNETFYLASAIRQHLAQLGQAPGGERPAGTYARQIFNRLLIDLSWNSSRLEGNTYSLLETDRLLELGKSAEGKSVRDAQMILNHKAAIELLVDQAAEIGFNRYTILNLHALLSDNLLADPQAGGRLRAIPVVIGGTVFHPLEVPQVIVECFDQILATATAINDPFEQAFFFMVQLPYLQPFEDVNKRVSRLAANIPLIRRNLCPLSFVDVPERDYIDGILGVYEMNRFELLRDVFVWAYERSCARYAAVRQSLGEPDPFRLRYRQALADIIGQVVRGRMDRKTADEFIHRQTLELTATEDRERFVEVAETEIMSLHEGNFARYRLRPREYKEWREVWSAEGEPSSNNAPRQKP
ncbi:MAG: Fic family protein [Candidatus Sumerlaeota bacterium]|nr:Fic family protein [Candidatus Sumerlaeota bacterium]